MGILVAFNKAVEAVKLLTQMLQLSGMDTSKMIMMLIGSDFAR
jgi:hypothetical protein